MRNKKIEEKVKCIRCGATADYRNPSLCIDCKDYDLFTRNAIGDEKVCPKCKKITSGILYPEKINNSTRYVCWSCAPQDTKNDLQTILL